MIDYVTLGKMKAEFEAVCARIDQKAAEAQQSVMSDAMQAILAGQYQERDRLLKKVGHQGDGTVSEATQKAKMEAWFRIGEKYGITRETATSWLREISH